MYFLTAPKILLGRPLKSPNRGAAVRAFWSRKRGCLLAAVLLSVDLPCVRGVLRGVGVVGRRGVGVVGGFFVQNLRNRLVASLFRCGSPRFTVASRSEQSVVRKSR